MINPDYAVKQLAGVWKMAWNAPDWTTSLDRSVDGVFRSFWALAIALPLTLVAFFSGRRAAERLPDLPPSPILETPFAVSMLLDTLAYLTDWAVGLAVLVVAARALGVARHAGDLIIGYNWLQVFAALAQLIPVVALSITLRPDLGFALALPVIAFMLALYWGVLRRGSDGSVGVVVALLALVALIGYVASYALTSIGFGLFKLLS